MNPKSQGPPCGSFIPRKNDGVRKLSAWLWVRPFANPRRIKPRTALAGTPPPNAPPESYQRLTLADAGRFRAYRCRAASSGAESFGRGVVTDPCAPVLQGWAGLVEGETPAVPISEAVCKSADGETGIMAWGCVAESR